MLAALSFKQEENEDGRYSNEAFRQIRTQTGKDPGIGLAAF
jgi:hypothetical protein